MTTLVLVATLAVGQCFVIGPPDRERWEQPRSIYQVFEHGQERARVAAYRPDDRQWSPADLSVERYIKVQPVACPSGRPAR